MDPDTCLTMAEEACAEGDFREAASCIEDYKAWRRQGGFEPDMGLARMLLVEGRIIVARLRMEGIPNG